MTRINSAPSKAAAQAAYNAHQAALPDKILYRSVDGDLVPMRDAEIAAHIAERKRMQDEAAAAEAARTAKAEKAAFDAAVAATVDKALAERPRRAVA